MLQPVSCGAVQDAGQPGGPVSQQQEHPVIARFPGLLADGLVRIARPDITGGGSQAQ